MSGIPEVVVSGRSAVGAARRPRGIADNTLAQMCEPQFLHLRSGAVRLLYAWKSALGPGHSKCDPALTPVSRSFQLGVS